MTFGPVFDSPDLLVAAPVIAVGAVGLALWARRRRLRRTRAWDRELARASARRNRTGPFLVAAAVLAAAIALAGPRGGRAQVTSATQALNVVFAVDISRSMLAEDVVPSRLGRGVREVRRLVQDLQGDRMGLVAFAGKSYILTPLTIDGGAIDLYLDGLDPDLVSEGGTRLAPVLTQGRELLSATSDGADRVLVVFTDGELHDSLDQARAAAKRLAEDGIHLVLVGEGQDAPVRIPVRDSAKRPGAIRCSRHWPMKRRAPSSPRRCPIRRAPCGICWRCSSAATRARLPAPRCSPRAGFRCCSPSCSCSGRPSGGAVPP
jgi:Ca-activated chloride channel family protein